MKNKTLILVPNLNRLAGISLHYKGLLPYWSGDIQYYETFKRNGNLIRDIFVFTYSHILFLFSIFKYNPNNVVLNISLKRGFYSQVIYQFVAKLLKKRVITFIHGWDVNSETMLSTSASRYIQKNTDAFIVLAKEFKKKLIKRGIRVPIYVSTTKVEDSLLAEFELNERNGSLKKFLFLSRVEKEKGVFLALEIVAFLQKIDPNISLAIAGEGSALKEAKQYVQDKNIKNILFLGRVDGKGKAEAYKNADCFFLLSNTEGMPAALLEAMAFGLPAIVSPVGGIPDFFIDGKMGIMSNSKCPKYYYDRIIELSSAPNIVKDMSFFNYNYAKSNFYASTVAKKLEEIFNQ